jgi:hypothetical protein
MTDADEYASSIYPASSIQHPDMLAAAMALTDDTVNGNILAATAPHVNKRPTGSSQRAKFRLWHQKQLASLHRTYRM